MTSHTDSDTNTDMPTITLQALAVAGDLPGWRVLDTARTQKFTGEITFQAQPSVSVYFDLGVPYHAVRAGDPSLCARLVDAGVVEPAQVERGVIRVGNVENLGRLFDRDLSIDRDAVMVVLELATDDVVTAVANTASSPFILTAYRHHVSGVHRWFVSPRGPGGLPAQLTPVGEVAQIDGSVTDDLPGLVTAVPLDDEIQIVWNQPISNESEAIPPIHSIDDDLLSRFVGDNAETASTDAPPAEVNGDFQILWPDGSEQHLTDIDINTTEHPVEALEVDHQQGSDSAAATPKAMDTPSTFSFDMPGLALTADDLPDEQQPEEVVDAVRRALEAIEVASAGPTQLPSVTIDSLPAFQPTKSLEFDVVDPLARKTSDATILTSIPTVDLGGASALETLRPPDEVQVIDLASAAAPVSGTDTTVRASPAGLGGFAAPTINDSAEAVYARAAAAERLPAGPASGVASVVFVDEAPVESDERSGALRRLIGSLRRK
jgi:hypothetical protein